LFRVLEERALIYLHLGVARGTGRGGQGHGIVTGLVVHVHGVGRGTDRAVTQVPLVSRRPAVQVGPQGSCHAYVPVGRTGPYDMDTENSIYSSSCLCPREGPKYPSVDIRD
jgi:hypothetical protein